MSAPSERMRGAEAGLSPDEVLDVLRERARALARPALPAPPADALEVLTFTLAQETCALESRFVHAVFRLGELTPLPGAAAPVVGVTGWRGDVLTVLDVRSMLDVKGSRPEGRPPVIVIGKAQPAFGVVADQLGEVALLQLSEIAADGDGRARDGGLVRAVTRAGVVLIDPERLLSLDSDGTST